MALTANVERLMKDLEEGLTKTLPGSPAVLQCPPMVDGVKVPYYDKGSLLIVPSGQPGFIFLLKSDKGVSFNDKLPQFLSKMRFPAIVILVRKKNIIVLTRLGLIEIDFSLYRERITADSVMKLLFNPESAIYNDSFSYSTNPVKHRVDKIDKNALFSVLHSAELQDANTLAEATNVLLENIRTRPSIDDQRLWSEIIRASIRLLPESLYLNDRKAFSKLVEAVSRAIVFLPIEEKVFATNFLVEYSLRDNLDPNDAEKIASIVLAIIPTLDKPIATTILKSYLSSLSGRRNIPPSLVQTFANYFDSARREIK